MWIAGNGPYMFTASSYQEGSPGVSLATIILDTEEYVHQFPFPLPPKGESRSWETIYSELEGAMRRPDPSTKESLLAIAGQCKPSNTTYVKDLILQLANSLDN